MVTLFIHTVLLLAVSISLHPFGLDSTVGIIILSLKHEFHTNRKIGVNFFSRRSTILNLIYIHIVILD